VSKCISPRGEFSEHTLDADFTCADCLSIDEDALLAELHRLRAAITVNELTRIIWRTETVDFGGYSARDAGAVARAIVVFLNNPT